MAITFDGDNYRPDDPRWITPPGGLVRGHYYAQCVESSGTARLYDLGTSPPSLTSRPVDLLASATLVKTVAIGAPHLPPRRRRRRR